MSALVTRGYGAGGSIPLVVLRGYVSGTSSEEVETASTAGLRGFMALELPHFLGGAGFLNVAADLAALVGNVAELGESATINGEAVDVIGVTPFAGVQFGGLEVEGRITRLYVTAADFDAVAAVHGSAVSFRSITYAIARFEHMDGGLVRVELQR